MKIEIVREDRGYDPRHSSHRYHDVVTEFDDNGVVLDEYAIDGWEVTPASVAVYAIYVKRIRRLLSILNNEIDATRSERPDRVHGKNGWIKPAMNWRVATDKRLADLIARYDVVSRYFVRVGLEFQVESAIYETQRAAAPDRRGPHESEDER